MNSLYAQLPALFVIVPLIASLVIVLFANKTFAKILFVLTNLVLLILSVPKSNLINDLLYYNFGGWSREIGIEFKLDILELYFVMLLYFVCVLFSLFFFSAFKRSLEDSLTEGRKHLPYALFLLVEAAYSGIIFTNDIFNLYVFIELASLASYPLIAISSNRRAMIAAFEYLVIGTIAATVILISIGLILSVVGSLNLEIIKLYFAENSSIVKYIVGFFLFGALIKIAAFPLHIWKINSYSATSIVVCNFFISISSLCAISLIIKFRFLIELIGNEFLLYIGIASLLFGSIAAIRESDYRKIIIYSSIGSVGYYLMLCSYSGDKRLLWSLLLVDSLSKLGLLMLPVALGRENLPLSDLSGFAKKHKFLAVIFVLLLLNAAFLPLTIGFELKWIIISLFLKNYIALMPILIASLLTVLNYVRIFRELFKPSNNQNQFTIDRKSISGIIFVVTVFSAGAVFLYYEIICIEISKLGLIFASLVTILWPVSYIYSLGYFKSTAESNRTRFLFFLNLSFLCAYGICFAGDMITMFMFYELLTLTTIPLVAHNATEQVEKAVKKYALYLFGGSLVLWLPAILYINCFSYDVNFTPNGIELEDFPQHTLIILLGLMLFGITKAAIFPFHSWLPSAMAANYPTSAVLHAVLVVNSGIYCIYKVLSEIFGIKLLHDIISHDHWLHYLLLLGVVYSGLMAIFQKNVKNILAWSTVSQLNLITLIALTGGKDFMSLSIQGLINHSFSKITLFFCMGYIYVAIKAVKLDDLKGVAKDYKAIFIMFVLGALALTGTPILAFGDYKKLVLNAAVNFDSNVLQAAIIASFILSMIYLGRIVFYMCLKPTEAHKRQKVSRHMLVATIFTSVLSLLANAYCMEISAYLMG